MEPPQYDPDAPKSIYFAPRRDTETDKDYIERQATYIKLLEYELNQYRGMIGKLKDTYLILRDVVRYHEKYLQRFE